MGRIGEALVSGGVLSSADSPLAAALSRLVKGSIDMLSDAAAQVPLLLGYPLGDTVQSEEFKPVSAGAQSGGGGGRICCSYGWVLQGVYNRK